MVEEKQAVLGQAVTALAGVGIPIAEACASVGIARSSYYRRSRGYRHYRPVAEPIPQHRRPQPTALSEEERGAILDVLTANTYAGLSVVQTYWRAFDTGAVACSQRTFYRVAKSLRMVGDRRRTRNQAVTSRRTPAVATTGVGQLWSWDITELIGPTRRDKYYLYLIIDVFSRYPVGWCIEHGEMKQRAVTLFTDAIATHGIPKVVHADNGSSMRSHVLIDALHRNGIVTSHSRPHVSDDNPFSEALFKTIKYDLEFPSRFHSIEHARSWIATFLAGYSNHHRHGSLGRQTPASVHHGTTATIHQQRQDTLDRYWHDHPERFRRRPTAPHEPQSTGINTHLLSQTG